MKHLLFALVLLLASSGLTAAEPSRPLVVAHRGLLLHAPENTLASFRACLELHLGFEIDVQRTKDGQLVCIHDDSVNRTTNGQGRVEAMTLEQIRQLDAGSWFDRSFAGEKVPTIDEIFKLLAEYPRHKVLVAVDLKAANVEAEVVKLAIQHQVLDRLLFIGRTIQEPAVRDRLKQASAAAQTSAVANNPEEFPTALEAKNADWVYFRYLAPKSQLDAVRAAGKRSFIAGLTVSGNRPENWQHTVDVGMTGVLTDYPLELRAMLRNTGKR